MFYSKSTGGFYDVAIHGEAIPSDAVEVSEALHAELIRGQAQGKAIVCNSAGMPVLADPPAPSQQAQIAAFTRAVQNYIDAPAVAWGYDDARSCISYLGDPHAQFAAEAEAMRDFRSACWVAAGAVRDEVLAGTRSVPTADELIADLPPAPSRPAA